MPNDMDLTNEQLALIAHKLDILIGNKEHRHPFRDYPKAAVLFHSINNLGYYFYSDTLEKVFDISKEKYSDNIKEDLKHHAESLTYLSDGLTDPILKDCVITREELAV